MTAIVVENFLLHFGRVQKSITSERFFELFVDDRKLIPIHYFINESQSLEQT